MTARLETPVLIAGAGPVGLALAMDLAWRGIETTIVEKRARAAPPPPKCNHVSARTMEIFRRLGVAGKLRNAGLPADYPNDVSYRTCFTGPELARIPIPCRRDRYIATDGPDTDWPTPEPPHRINQIFLEPILFDHAAQMPRLHILCETELEAVDYGDDGARARARDLKTGEPLTVDCRYLIGCDGGSSLVRKAIGARLHGDPVVQRAQSSFIRAPALIGLQREERAWATFSLNPRRSGNVYAIDGRETWIVHNYLRPGEEDFAAIDRDWAIRTILGVDDSFEYEIIAKEDWFGRRLVADRFRDGPVFICGDAAHIWVPYGGYGMNAGVADAANLAWLLAAHLNGWAGPAILDAYEAERLPITHQVSHFAMDHAHAMANQRGSVPANLEEDSPAGAAARAELGARAYDLNVQQYCCAGLNFGYYYDRSPIVAYDGAAHPPYSMAGYTPSTVPGCRAPHFWLGEGRSFYDALGPEYTLVRFDRSVEVSTILSAAREKRFPLAMLDAEGLASVPAPDRLLIVRPDQHVAWRGDEDPGDPGRLLDKLAGRGG
ncbi:MAG: FAD-dependent oxidoreductase [Rhodospirillaceae bacterium]|nr:FAD-dependent oxidoreductase [Rhodospirillaceae bacterium]